MTPVEGYFVIQPEDPELLRQILNDTETETLWLIIGPPEKEVEPGEVMDQKLLYPGDPKQLPAELSAVVWPPKL